MPRSMTAGATAVLLALLGGLARADEPAPLVTGTPSATVLLPPPAVPAGPPAAGCPCACGDGGTMFDIDLMLGMQLGIRGQAAVYRDETSAFVLEGFYGLLLDKLAAGEGAGAGGRYYFRRTNRDGCNSLLIGPGVGAYYHFHDEVWMLAPTLDIAWVRAISDTGAWQIGLNAGLGINVGDRCNPGDVGRVTPLFTLFTGFRF
jgi:hypothetical protein